jgi:hypothetical protein
MTRAISVNQFFKKKRKIYHLEGDFKNLIGSPEKGGTWIVWGDSSNGKTTFVCQLAKYLTKFSIVLYNSMEEGDSESLKKAFVRVGMNEVKRRLLLLPNEPIEQMKERLRLHKSAKIVIVDSIQYSQMTYKEYKALKEEFPKHLFIFISHEENKLPEGKVAKKVRYDASVKIRVNGYVAFASSRYAEEESKPYTIWKEGAEKFHGIHF